MLACGHLGVVDIGEALLKATGTIRSPQGAVPQPETAHSCQSAKRCETGIDLNRRVALGYRTAEQAGVLILKKHAEGDGYQDEEQCEPGERRQDIGQIHGCLPFNEGEYLESNCRDCISDADRRRSQDQRDRAAGLLDRWDIGDPTEVLLPRGQRLRAVGRVRDAAYSGFRIKRTTARRPSRWPNARIRIPRAVIAADNDGSQPRLAVTDQAMRAAALRQ
jgi:hypothetical protein